MGSSARYDLEGSSHKQKDLSSVSLRCLAGIFILGMLFICATILTIILVAIFHNPESSEALPAISKNNGTRDHREPNGCLRFNEADKNTRKRSVHRRKRWLNEADCPALGEAICPDGFEEPPLLLISMDGFRADYLQRGFTPTLQKLSECGTHAPFMRTVYPSMTFPNHYTIVTGLFTESHGIIDNVMYDLDWSEQFRSGSTALDGKWWEGEPMWLTSKRQGKKSAALFWPGSDANITGEYPDYCYYYDQSVEYQTRIDTVMAWLDLPADERPSFINLYFDEPDGTGHNHGPFFSEIDDTLVRMDEVVSDLLDALHERQLDRCINIVILADHGMSEIFCNDNTVYMEDYLNTSQYYIYPGEAGRISSKYVEQDGQIVEIPEAEIPEETLDKLECQFYNTSKDYYVRFYDKKELPKRFHYANHRRIDDVTFELEDKWKVYIDRRTSCEYGGHGFDNLYKSMNALFMAYGPSFKQRLKIDPFDNIEVYNLMAELLDVEPAPNNGTISRLHHILSDPIPLAPRPDTGNDYITCEYPDDTEAERRRNASDCTCSNLSNMTDKSIEELDQRLNLTPEEISAAEQRHLPFGIPQVVSADIEVCLLHQYGYITGYSYAHGMPVFSAFTMNKQENRSIFDGFSRTDIHEQDCIRTDVRVENATQCSDLTDEQYKLVASFLYPPGLGNSTGDDLDGYISSNVVPMYEGFRTGVWQELLYLAEEYTDKFDTINVVVGPVFDYNADGHADSIDDISEFVLNGSVPVPSHFFMTLMHCDGEAIADTCYNSSEIMSVVLRHRPTLSNCWDERPFRYLQENVMRLTDIESLTNLHFLTSLEDEHARIMLNTHTEAGLWPRASWNDLTEEEAITDDAECPVGYNQDFPPVILISIDGFRPDYLTRNLTPTISRLTEFGVSPEYLRSVYPTMTFPNHHTISTGLYPESHGIIDNSMYDMELRQNFRLGSENAMNPEWWQGEPIWNTLLLQNKTAMTFFWPGSDVEIGGVRPTVYKEYEGDMPYHLRVDTALQWLNGSEGAIPDFISLYFSNVDSMGHQGGPDSLLVNEALEKIDIYIKRLMDGLYRMRLHKCVNVIILSDHGMSDISCDRGVIVNDHLYPGTLQDVYMYSGTSSRIANEYTYGRPEYDHIDEVDRVPYSELRENLTCVSENLRVFEKHMLPKRHHYINHERIDDLVFVLTDRWQADRFSPWCRIIGQHGWDPSFPNLHAFFSAFGPAFQNRLLVPPFENIEIYNILATLTNVTASPNNGTEGSLYHLLKDPPKVPYGDSFTPYSDCNYPQDESVYRQRANATDCDCELENIEEADERLNMSDISKSYLELYHIPHGVPGVLDGSACILHHSDFVSGYSSDMLMPIWSAYTLTSDQLSSHEIPDCKRPDVRLESEHLQNCSDYQSSDEIQPSFLFPPEFASSQSNVTDTLTSSNSVPMFTSFRSGIWNELLNLIYGWTQDYGKVHVLAGPVFDHMADGMIDQEFTTTLNGSMVPLPSHYYVIVLRCDNLDCTSMNYSTQAFVVPHAEQIYNCMNATEFLEDNRARIRDIELLTGLEFLTAARNGDEPTKQMAIQTRTLMQDEWWICKKNNRQMTVACYCQIDCN